MGISLNPLSYVLRCKSILENANVLILGRQQINLRSADAALIDRMFRDAGIDYDYRACSLQSYADELFFKVGCSSVTYMDYSDYEGATFIHDLNQPLNDGVTCFDVVIDGGTLEHVFNVPAAFLNINRLLTVSGNFIALSPGNNWLGHGMYQFSPELFWTGLGSCGFDTQEVLLMLRNKTLKAISLPDTRLDGQRREVNVPSGIKTDIFANAVKVKDALEVDVSQAQQEDYKTLWAR